MWKKDEEQTPVRPSVVAAPSPEPAKPAPSRPEPVAFGATIGATIGPSIVIKGEVSGNEDLLIQGRIDGAVALDLHAVTVGGGGRVKANISGRVITIEGDVEGDLTAKEQIVLRGSATVLGDLKAPRVVLEDGATFRGLVDMGASRQGDEAPKRETASATEGAAARSGASGAAKPASPTPVGAPAESGPAAAGPEPVRRGGGAPHRRVSP